MRQDIEGYDDEEPSQAEQEQGAHKPSRGELQTLVLATAGLIYGVATLDIPVSCLTLGFILVETRYFVEKYCGAPGRVLSGIMKGLGTVLLIGALFLLVFS